MTHTYPIGRWLRRTFVLGGLLCLLTIPAGPGQGADDDKKAAPPKVVKGKEAEELIRLKLEVDVLEKLHHFEPTPSQLAALLGLAEKTAAKMPAEKEATVGAEYGKTLQQLYAALLKGDEDLIDQLGEQLEELDEKEMVEIPDEFEMTDAALKVAPQAIKLLSGAQVISYLAALDDEVPDPLERIISTIAEGEEFAADEWKDLRDETAEEVGWLIGGFDTENSRFAAKTVGALLDRGHRYKGDELKKELPNLEKAARQLVGNVNPSVVIQHYMERELAELLSNPRALAGMRAYQENQPKE